MVRRLLLVGAAAAVMMCVSPVFAGAWATPAGSGDNFAYSGGGDINGLFGEPFVFGDSFFFSTSFQVNAENGTTQQQDDTVSFDVLANAGLSFSSMTIAAFGSYGVTGDSSVDVGAVLSMTENGGLGRTFADALSTDVPFPATSGSGLWNGDAAVDVSFVFPSPHNDIHLELANNVLAITTAGGTAEINMGFEQLEIGFTMIPEPASLSLLAIGALALVRRRR